ncbi:MAG: LysR substrate-binding domain-containing protein, partial [Flavobacteriales bacterium]
MNFQQIQYLLAVSELKHFERAAEKCFVTQSTLSTMISKFEDEIGIKVFDRRTKPVSITAEGDEILKQLKLIDQQVGNLNETVKLLKGEMSGTLKIAAIPTVSPYVFPKFLKRFSAQFPDLTFEVREMNTKEMMQALKSRELDIGIAAVPLLDKELMEIELYNEPFVLYDCSLSKTKSPVVLDELNLENFWLLEEGHCLRTQVAKICDLENCDINPGSNINFKAGSIESLLHFVEMAEGQTLLPYLAGLELSTAKQKRLTPFNAPTPMRSVGLVVHQHFVKRKILNLLHQDIKKHIAPLIPNDSGKSELIS